MFFVASLLQFTSLIAADTCWSTTRWNLSSLVSNYGCYDCFLLRLFEDCVSCRNFTEQQNTSIYNFYCYPRGAELQYGIDSSLCSDPCNTTGYTPLPTPPVGRTGGAVCPGRNSTSGCTATPDNCALLNQNNPNCRFCQHETPCPVCVAATDNCYAPDPNNIGKTIVDPNAGPPLLTTATISYVLPPSLGGPGPLQPTTTRKVVADAICLRLELFTLVSWIGIILYTHLFPNH